MSISVCMRQVYNFMAAGLGVTGLVAYAAVATGLYQQIAGTPLIWLVMLAPLGAVLFLSFRIERMSTGAAQATFWTYAALMGLSLAGIFCSTREPASRASSSSPPGPSPR